MAQLNSRGTQTRTRWDYFEHSNGVAFAYGSVVSGPIGVYFINNSTGATALDIYAISWSASLSLPWSLVFLLPPQVLTTIPPTESNVRALQPDVGQPPGVIGTYIANAGVTQTLLLHADNNQGGTIAPIMGTYFATLPPSWGMAIGGFGSNANPCTMSMTVWYQYVTDNIAPAP